MEMTRHYAYLAKDYMVVKIGGIPKLYLRKE